MAATQLENSTQCGTHQIRKYVVQWAASHLDTRETKIDNNVEAAEEDHPLTARA